MSLNIMDKLYQNVNSDPNTNYDIVIAEIVNAREKHIPCKLVKYNIYKHNKSMYMDNTNITSLCTWIIQT